MMSMTTGGHGVGDGAINYAPKAFDELLRFKAVTSRYESAQIYCGNGL